MLVMPFPDFSTGFCTLAYVNAICSFEGPRNFLVDNAPRQLRVIFSKIVLFVTKYSQPHKRLGWNSMVLRLLYIYIYVEVIRGFLKEAVEFMGSMRF